MDHDALDLESGSELVPGAQAVVQNGTVTSFTNPFGAFYKELSKQDKRALNRTLSELEDGLMQGRLQVKDIQCTTLVFGKKRIQACISFLYNFYEQKNGLLIQITPRELAKEEPRDKGTENPNLPKAQKRQAPLRLASAFSELIGRDPNFMVVLLKAQKAAKSDFPVLITGESGTGKEVLAKTIHRTSQRKSNHFVDINCAAIPDQLIDSELFGYEKGAFTGANLQGSHGLFKAAHQGTLFFDEIADATSQTQAKLLRVINEGYYKKVGSTKNIKVDVRIISATNKNLNQMIEEKYFREDLLYRLNTINIHVPPLRERPSDISLLANHFLDQLSEAKKQKLKISKTCLKILETYHWPGNVRELKSVLDYAATMADTHLITEKFFPDFLFNDSDREIPEKDQGPKQAAAQERSGLLLSALQQTEYEVMKVALEKAKTKSEAIQMLGISRRKFYYKLKQYDLF